MIHRVYSLLAAAFVALFAIVPTASAQFASSNQGHTIGLGYVFSCAIDRAGTGVLCWGSNKYGQLGAGIADTMVTRPVAVRGLPAGVKVLSVRAGYEHACALLDGGGVMCWGRNHLGQLGDGTTTDRRTATVVWGFPGGGAANGATRLATGAYFTCVVRRDATAWCWGENRLGQVGDGTYTDRHTPYQVVGLSGVADIEAGAASTYARLSNGSVMAWGLNQNGDLGIGSPAGGSNVPVVVPALSSGVTLLAASKSPGACAVKSGALLCWGQNTNGRVGDGTTTNRDTPTPVALTLPAGVTVQDVETGYAHTCAELSNATVQCWGQGDYGQMGNGAMNHALRPVAMLSPPSGQAAEVAVGYFHTCVRTGAGQLYCAGNNYYGQLGNGESGSGTTRSTPVLVTGGQFVDVAAPEAPEHGAALSSPSPSPSHGLTRVTLTLATPERISARLVDVLGREVATVFDGTAAAGQTPLSLDVSGQAPGLYRLVVVGEASGLRLSRPLVVVR